MVPLFGWSHRWYLRYNLRFLNCSVIWTAIFLVIWTYIVTHVWFFECFYLCINIHHHRRFNDDKHESFVLIKINTFNYKLVYLNGGNICVCYLWALCNTEFKIKRLNFPSITKYFSATGKRAQDEIKSQLQNTYFCHSKFWQFENVQVQTVNDFDKRNNAVVMWRNNILYFISEVVCLRGGFVVTYALTLFACSYR